MRTIIALLACSASLIGCVDPRPAINESAHQAEEVRTSFRSFLKCAIHFEPALDDQISDARTIALLLTDRCAVDYAAAINAAMKSAVHGDDPRLKALWLQKQDTSQAKVEASIDIVLSMRRGDVPNPRPDGPLLVPP